MTQPQGDDQPQGNVEEPQGEVQTDEEPTQADAPEPVPSSEQVESELPTEASERTKEQFEKLKQEKEEWKAKAEAKPPESPFSFMHPQSETPPQEPEPVVEDGYVDEAKLNQSLKEANDKANQAYQYAQTVAQQTQQQEEARQVAETYAVYPQLNPESEKYNPEFTGLVQNKLVAEYAAGKNPNYLAAAKEMSKFISESKPQKKEEPSGPIETGSGEERVVTPTGNTDEDIAARLDKKTGNWGEK